MQTESNRQMIVSLTSYPERIGTLHLVLQSLYAQSMKPEKIIVWLAEEQFPNKTDGLPSVLVKDMEAGLVDVRWCENLGAHKKYFFTMQEYPDSVIVTVDDDLFYGTHMLETLYESYKRFPKAISAHHVSLLLFDAQGKLLPCSRWVLPYEVLRDKPSLQLMAIGSRGILYPPGIIDKRAFDEGEIRKFCTVNGVVFHDDPWLKIHELTHGVPVVYTGGVHDTRRIPEAQKVALKRSAKNELLLWDAEDALWKDVQNRQKFKQLLSRINDDPSWVPLEEDAVLVNVACKFESLVKTDSIDRNRTINVINSSITELNHVKALGVSDEKWKRYIREYQRILQDLSGLEELSMETLSFHALKDHGFALRTGIWETRFKDPLQFDAMLASWKSFFAKNSDCDPVYRKGFKKFVQNMLKYEYESKGNFPPKFRKLMMRIRKKFLLRHIR